MGSDLRCVLGQNAGFRAGWIVFRQQGNFFKKFRAPFIIKPPARNGFLSLGKPINHVVFERILRVISCFKH